MQMKNQTSDSQLARSWFQMFPQNAHCRVCKRTSRLHSGTLKESQSLETLSFTVKLNEKLSLAKLFIWEVYVGGFQHC